MNTSEFYQRIAEILETEEVTAESVLRDYEAWDSLSVLSVLAMFDAKYGVTAGAAELRSAVMVGDLLGIVEAKQADRERAAKQLQQVAIP